MAEVAHVWLKSNERRFSEVKEAPQFSRGLYLYSLCIVIKWSHNMCLKASSSVARAQDFLSWILDSAKQHSPLQILSCSEHRKLTPTQRVPVGTTSCFILESSEQETVGIFSGRNLISPCSPSAAVLLKSPRIEVLFKGPNSPTGGSLLPSV